MQLKFIISFICLILSSNAIKSLKNLKNKEKTVTYLKNKQDSSQYTYNIIPATKLFKELALSVFDGKQMEIRRCVDEIENNSDLGSTPFRELWEKSASITKEFFSKQQMEANAKGGSVAPDRIASLKAFSNWDELLIEEFKTLARAIQNKIVKDQCADLFSKVRGNVYDLLNILQKSDYMGLKFNDVKGGEFIDSQYSIYRDKIQAGAFKRLNDKSDELMSAYNRDMKVIQGSKRGIPKAPSPYDSVVIPLKKDGIIVIYFFII